MMNIPCFKERFIPVVVAAVLCVMAVIMSGCTHNDGNIGPWFGTWSLRSVTYDGITDSNYEHNVFWSFQNEVVRMEVDKQLGNFTEHFGSWENSGDILVLNFTHTDNSHFPWEGVFDFPDGIGLPKSGVVSLEILRMTDRYMTLSYVNYDDVTVIYNLKKVY